MLVSREAGFARQRCDAERTSTGPGDSQLLDPRRQAAGPGFLVAARSAGVRRTCGRARAAGVQTSHRRAGRRLSREAPRGRGAPRHVFRRHGRVTQTMPTDVDALRSETGIGQGRRRTRAADRLPQRPALRDVSHRRAVHGVRRAVVAIAAAGRADRAASIKLQLAVENHKDWRIDEMLGLAQAARQRVRRRLPRHRQQHRPAGRAARGGRSLAPLDDDHASQGHGRAGVRRRLSALRSAARRGLPRPAADRADDPQGPSRGRGSTWR